MNLPESGRTDVTAPTTRCAGTESVSFDVQRNAVLRIFLEALRLDFDLVVAYGGR